MTRKIAKATSATISSNLVAMLERFDIDIVPTTIECSDTQIAYTFEDAFSAKLAMSVFHMQSIALGMTVNENTLTLTR